MMKRLLRAWIVIFAILFLAPPLWAAYYSYRDTNGVLHFTDRLDNVPDDLLPRVKFHPDVPSAASPPEPAGKAAPAPSENLNLPPVKTPRDHTIEALQRQRAQLFARYRRLVEERKRLTKMYDAIPHRPRIRSRKRHKVFNKKALDFNQRVTAYENTRRAFNSRVPGYGVEPLPAVSRLANRVQR